MSHENSTFGTCFQVIVKIDRRLEWNRLLLSQLLIIPQCIFNLSDDGCVPRLVQLLHLARPLNANVPQHLSLQRHKLSRD